MVNLKDLHLTTFGNWEEPYESEQNDQAHLRLLLERIVSALRLHALPSDTHWPLSIVR